MCPDIRRRVKSITASGTTIFVYDAMGKLIAEYTSGSGSGSGTSYITSDMLGSPRIITGTNPSSIVKARHDYLPFGEEINAGVGGRAAGQGYVVDNMRQKFTGYERDGESGLDYAQARYYSSAMGRFNSADSFAGDMANPQTLNLYAYVLNDPLALADPTGHISESQYDGTEEKIRELMKLAKEFGKIPPHERRWLGQNPRPTGPIMPTPDLLTKVLEAVQGIFEWVSQAVDDAKTFVVENFYMPSPLDYAVGMYNAFNVAWNGKQAGCPGCEFLVIIDADRYPPAAEHIEEAVAAGKPRTVTLDRVRRDARRSENMKRSGLPPSSVNDRDEYPLAIFEESADASVKYVPKHDNRGVGNQMMFQLNYPNRIPDGAKVMLYTTKSIPIKFP